MSTFLRIDINLAAMVMLTIVCVVAYQRLDRQDQMNRLFLLTSTTVIFELFFEAATCVINGRKELWLIPFTIFFHICLYSIGPLLTYFWYSFLRYWVAPEDDLAKWQVRLMRGLVVVNSILTVASPVGKFIFYIDDKNIYHRGSFFVFNGILIYLYIFLGMLLLLKYRSRLVREEFIPLFIFGILPLIGGILQSLFYGLLLVWSTTAFSLVIVYIFVQQRMVQLDGLTGAWSRISFDYYLKQLQKNNTMDGIGAVFIDIDGLKQINDHYGHPEGDFVLKTSVELIKMTLRKTDVVGRYGGDEFVVILHDMDHTYMDNIISRIQKNFENYNQISQKEYHLGCSIGGDYYNSEKDTVDDFIERIDQIMYANKQLKQEQYQTKKTSH